MKEVDTFYANVYIGRQEGYSGKVHTYADVIAECETFCNTVLCGVTVTETEFVYVDGKEPGVIVGFIQYPRFPKPEEEILRQATGLGKRLQVALNQERFSIMTPTKTYMFEREGF